MLIWRKTRVSENSLKIAILTIVLHVAVGQVSGHGIGRTHSGDIILALSTYSKPDERVMNTQVNGIGPVKTNHIEIVKNESIDAMFKAASEVTKEAILKSMIAGTEGRRINGFPVDFVKETLKKHRVDI